MISLILLTHTPQKIIAVHQLIHYTASVASIPVYSTVSDDAVNMNIHYTVEGSKDSLLYTTLWDMSTKATWLRFLTEHALEHVYASWLSRRCSGTCVVSLLILHLMKGANFRRCSDSCRDSQKEDSLWGKRGGFGGYKSYMLFSVFRRFLPTLAIYIYIYI